MNDDKKVVFYKIKFIIIGNQAVGKTNLAHCFAHGTFKKDYYITLGMDYLSHNVQVDGKNFKLELWDTAGSEKFKSITKGYYQNSLCAIVVYDITDKSSFLSVNSWIADCKNFSNQNIHLILVGNKIDLENQRVISSEEGKDFAEKNEMSFYETSALNGLNVNNIFIDACKLISKNIDNGVYPLENNFNGIQKCETITQFYLSDIEKDSNTSKKKNKKKKFC